VRVGPGGPRGVPASIRTQNASCFEDGKVPPLSAHGYREEELVTNRVSLLLSSGTEEERRHWAEEAAGHFSHEGPLIEVRQLPELAVALRRPRGVVFIPDVAKLGLEAQAQLLRCLQTQEERPKVVVGLSGTPESAMTRGVLRTDLHYRLHQARVDLNAEGLRERLRKRRADAEARAARLKPPAASKATAGKPPLKPVVRRDVPARAAASGRRSSQR
jgi:hypothetical protein